MMLLLLLLLLLKGIKSVISTSFADIFYNNCFKNGMLPIVLGKEHVRNLMIDCDNNNNISIDLEKQIIKRSNGEVIVFEIDSFRKHCLINGLLLLFF